MSIAGSESFDTFGDEFKAVTTRLERLEKITDGELIVMPDGTTYTMGDLGLTDVSVRVYIQSDMPTGLNSSTNVGDIWNDTDDGSFWFWDGLMWVSKSPADSYSGGTGLEAFGPGVVSRLLTSIDIFNQGTAPSPTYGDTWRDISAGNIIKRWDGSQWVQITDQNIINAVNAALTDSRADVTDNVVRVFYTTTAPGGLNSTTHKGDLWYDTDDSYAKYLWNGTAWVSATDEEVAGETDGVPPSYSPTPEIVSGIGSLFVTWTAVENADPVWYNIYIDDVSPVQQIGANNLGMVWGEVMAVQALPDGTPLAPDTTYYVRLVAVDADGAAPISPEASGQITKIDLEQFANDVRTSIENIPTIQATADGKNTNFYQASMPTGGTYAINDAWFDTDDGYKPYRWDGDSWEPYQFSTQALAAGSITSSLISAGAVTADKISANSISADALIIGSIGSGLVFNPSFETDFDSSGKPDGWTLAEGVGTTWARTNLADAPDGQYVLSIPAGGNMGIGSKAFSIAPGTVYYFRARIRSTGTTGTYVIRVNYSSTQPSGGFVTATNRTSYTDIKPATTHSTSWLMSEMAWTAPANARWASVVVINLSGSFTLYADDVDTRTQTTSVMIADGAISATKIGANSVTANAIAANAITSDKLAANSVIAGKVAASAISASNITSGAIQSYHIASYSITADKISSGAINGQTITGVWIYGNVFRSTNWSYYVEMGDVGSGDAAHEIRFIYAGTTMSLRNASAYPGSALFSLYRNFNSNLFYIWGTDDGWLWHGRSGGGPKLKYVGDTVQVRNHSDSDFHDLRVRVLYHNTGSLGSKLEMKENVRKLAVDPIAAVKKNGLHKWKWKKGYDADGYPDDTYEGVGLIADYLPDEVRTAEGYDVGGVMGLMWDAIRILNERVEGLEGGK